MSLLPNTTSSCQFLASLLLLLWASTMSQAWVSPRIIRRQQGFSLHMSAAVNSETGITENFSEQDDNDEEEYEYVEYEMLTESDFVGSEWLVGTVMDRNKNKIVETWVRLAADKNGKNVAIWGDDSEGTWNFDVANQFLSMGKESIIGKDIWAGVMDDYYFTQGTVRGWNFLTAAAVVGQWQAKRLGVEKDEAGTAPWFEENEEADEESPLAVSTEESPDNE